MTIDSRYFDRIRVKPDADRTAGQAEDGVRPCQAEGCDRAGTYPAPKGRGQEGEYVWFCLEHVRAYNKAYNYFSGMPDDDVIAYQRESVIGHRPTWAMGGRAARARDGQGSARQSRVFPDPFEDPHGVFGETRYDRPHDEPPRRRLHNRERKSLDTLGLDPNATAQDVKLRYKELVKRHHPDSNGGDRSREDRLRDIIQAYRYLKDSGFC